MLPGCHFKSWVLFQMYLLVGMLFYCRVFQIMYLCKVLDVKCLKRDINAVLNIVGLFFQASKGGGLTE